MNFLERVGLVSQVKVGDYVVSANKPLGNGAFGTVNVGHKQTVRPPFSYLHSKNLLLLNLYYLISLLCECYDDHEIAFIKTIVCRCRTQRKLWP